LLIELSIEGVVPAIYQVAPVDLTTNWASGIVISLGAIALGIALLMITAIVHRAEITALGTGQFPSSTAVAR